MTRWRILAVLVLIVAAIFAGSAFPAGDFTADATTNANSDRVKVDNTAPFSLGSAHSIASWTAHPTASLGQVHVAKQTGGTARHIRNATAATNQANVQASSGAVSGAGYSLTAGTAGVITDGGWHSVVLLFDSGSNANLWMDAQQGTDSSVAATDDPGSKVYLGVEQSGAEDNFTLTTDHRGYLDAVRVYSRRLGVNESSWLRERNAKASRISPAGLEGYWPMRGVPGTSMGTVRDHSASRADGTAGGTTLPTYSESYLRGVR